MGDPGDVSSVMAMLRSSKISDPPTSTSTGTPHGTRCSDSDHQFSIGFVMSPRMFAESFNIKKFRPGSFATIQEDGGITSDSLRVYHWRQFMVKQQSRPDLPLMLQDSVQLDCQHRPVLVRFASEDIHPIDPARDGVQGRNAERMASMAEALTRAGLRLNVTHTPGDREQAPPDSAPRGAAETDTVIIETNLGNFRRQQNKLVVKAYVRPEAFAKVLHKAGRSSEAAVPFPEDQAWVYKARWITSLPFMFAHQSISRINTNAHSVVLQGDIRSHGFRPGPVLTFQRNGQPQKAQIYFSVVFPYFFVSTSLQRHSRNGAAEIEAAAAMPAAASDVEPDSVGGAEGQAPKSVHVACFDSDDLLHVMHAVVKRLSAQDSRGAEGIATAMRRTESDDVGLQVTIVPLPFGTPEKVFEADSDGFNGDELEEASQQKAGDVGAPRQLILCIHSDFLSPPKATTFQ